MGLLAVFSLGHIIPSLCGPRRVVGGGGHRGPFLGSPVCWARGSLEMWRPGGGEVEELRERRPLSKCVRMKTLRNIRGRLCVLVGVVAVR